MKKILELLGIGKEEKTTHKASVLVEDGSNLPEFEWVTKKWVKSRDGFEVKSLGRYELEYTEPNGFSLKIKRDVGFTCAMEPCVIVSPGVFASMGAREGEIKDNFVKAMKFQGMEVSFE